MEERDYWYWLGTAEEFGAAAGRRLLSLYGDPENVFRQKQLPVSDKQQEALDRSRRQLDRLLKERDSLEKEGIFWCCPTDPNYPKRLRSIPDPPLVLFGRGRLPPEEQKAAAVIGARRCSHYGRTLAERFGRELAQAGIAVISGMAVGIDGCAQTAALDAGGCSYGVLGSGIDRPYPPSNRMLYRRLTEQGGVISEFKPGTPPLPYHFPLRNRIISGMCDVLLVVEARAVSGTLITVDQALEQGRDVLAAPGRLDDPLSEGCNSLIRQGAGILTGTGDVLAALGLADPEGSKADRAAAERAKKTASLSPDAKAVYRSLSHDPMHLEEIMMKTGFGLGEVSLLLLLLEEKELIRPVSAGTYVRT